MAQEAKFTFRGSQQTKDKWVDACEAIKVPANSVFLSLAEFFLSLDETTRGELVRRPGKVKVSFKQKR